jgi:hypothetical protein
MSDRDDDDVNGYWLIFAFVLLMIICAWDAAKSSLAKLAVWR